MARTTNKLTLPYDKMWWEFKMAEGYSNPNEYILLDFDPGAAATGWSMFGIDVRAFASSEAKILQHLLWWDCGEISGTETQILSAACRLIDEVVLQTKRNNRIVPPIPALHILTEDFNLMQTIGDKENLLSPVRQNAVLEWECHKRGTTLKYQKPNERIGVTAERLTLYGFEGRWSPRGKGKDQFAAMQHGVVWLKKLKRESISAPWRVQKEK